MSLQTIKESNFRNAVSEKDITFVEFSTQWCPPCKVLHPILEELQHEDSSRLSILHVDCDDSPQIAAEFGIMSTPTVIVFHKGEPIDKIIGLRPKSVYQAALTRYA